MFELKNLVTETERGACEHGKTKRDSVVLSRYSPKMCLDLGFRVDLRFSLL